MCVATGILGQVQGAQAGEQLVDLGGPRGAGRGDGGEVAGTYPVAIGTAENPTPLGRFYVRELADLSRTDPGGPYGSATNRSAVSAGRFQ